MLTDCDFYCKQSITELQAQLAHKKKKIQILKQEKNSMLNRIDELNEKVHDQAEEFKKYRLKFRGLEKNHTHLKYQNENLKKDQSLANEAINLYQKGFKRDEFKKHERTIAQLQSDIVKLSTALEEHKIVRESNSEELTKQLIYINELENQLKQYQTMNEADQLKFHNQELYQTVEDLNSQLQMIGPQKDQEYRQQIQELQTQNELTQIELKECNLKLTQSEKAFQQKLLKLMNTFNSAYEELTNKFGDKQEYREILSKLKLSKKDIDLEVAKIESEINVQTCEQLQNQVENLANENENIKVRFQQTSTNKEALQMREKDLIYQIEKLQQQVEKQKNLNAQRQKTMAEQVQALQRTNKQMTFDMDKMTKELEDLRAEKEILQQTIQRQEKKIQTLCLQSYK